MPEATTDVSKYTLSDLAVRSAVELERRRLGMAFDQEVLLEFSSALLGTSGAVADDVPFRFVAPGYYLPLERLCAGAPDVDLPVENIQEFVRTMSDRLARVAKSQDEPDKDLTQFCVALHQELIEEMTAEESIGPSNWWHLGHEAAPRLGPA